MLASGMTNGERFYVLKNVMVKKGYPWFVDIWILIKKSYIRTPVQNKILTDLDKMSRMGMSNWQAQMIYPYK